MRLAPRKRELRRRYKDLTMHRNMTRRRELKFRNDPGPVLLIHLFGCILLSTRSRHPTSDGRLRIVVNDQFCKSDKKLVSSYNM